MKKYTMRIASLLAAGLLALSLAACSPAPQQAASGTQATVSGISHNRGGRWRQEKKYTQADYDLAMSFEVEGYREISVDAFDRSVLDWQDEEAYHKNEEVLQRLFGSLPDDDPNAEFILETLGAAWNECEKKHYNACARDENPWYSGWVEHETYGDVFGDPLLLTGAYVNYDFDYRIPDGAAITVGERDAALQSVRQSLGQFLESQTPERLQQQEALEKTLKKELENKLKTWKGGLIWGGSAELSYYYEDLHQEARAFENTVVTGETAEGNSYDRYTKRQYDLAVKALQFPGYRDLSLAQFNRRLNAAFADDDYSDDGLNLAYEMLQMYLEDTDANAAFFRTTVAASLEEYSARTQEVYTGRQVDPAWRCRIGADIEEDVFGDTVTAGGVTGECAFTYQIVDADALTVAERDAFLQAVDDGAQSFLRQVVKDRTGDEAGFKAAVEAAGKAASNEKIRFTGCEIEYFEVY